MEKSYWFRVAVIALMLVGSVYVLLPTILQEDAQSRFQSSAASVETPTTDSAPSYEVALDVEGDAAAMAAAIESRLKGAKVAIDGVKVDGQRLTVLLDIGTTRQDVVAALGGSSTVALYDFASVAAATSLTTDGVVEPAELPEGGIPSWIGHALDETAVTWSQLQSLATRPVPSDLAQVGAVTSWQGSDPAAIALRTASPLGDQLAVVAVDGAFVGVAGAVEDGARFRAFEDGTSRAKALGVWLAEGITIVEPEQGDAPTVAQAPTDAEGSSRVPVWLAGLLPDTRMNLGLDLQGGIDLTLQVELDEAVLSQVGRDLTYMKEQAAREGVTISAAKSDKREPIMTVTTASSLSDLQTWMVRGMPDYEYLESTAADTHVFRMREERIERVGDQAVEQVLETLRKRVDATGVKEPSIVKKGGGAINVQLPGVVDLQQAIDAIGTTAVLEFRLVDEEFDEAELQRIVSAAEDALPPEQYAHDPSLNEWLWRTGRLPENRLVMFEYEDTPEGIHQRTFPLVMKGEVILSGNDVNNAGVAFDNNNLPYVSLEFKPQGSRVFCTVTTEHEKKRFGIILDGEVKSAPVIRERICGGRASIEMGSSLDALDEAETLALVLRTGSLNAPVSVGQVRTVGATLGQDAIQSGSIATVIGGSLVLVFMAFWYGKAGMLANVALVLNVCLVMATLALFGATLTLPGIAGIALTVGMAVDANIIIYERIREELQLGQHARKAVDTGFDKGLVAVLDANITTAIAGVVLFSYGTGPIKGFAVTLLIGIVTTLITALFVNRTLLELATRNSRARLRL